MELVPNYRQRWDALRSRFGEVIHACLPRHSGLLLGMEGDLATMPNILLYGSYGFPHDLLWKEAIRRRFDVARLLPSPCTWGKDLQYTETPYYIQVDMNHPTIPKDIETLQDFLKAVITTRSITAERHIIILENIDALVHKTASMNTFRVLLERFSKNVWFICTTYHVGMLEPPLRSRFQGLRVPLPTEEENRAILQLLDGTPAQPAAAPAAAPAPSRNLIHALVTPAYPDEYMRWLSCRVFPPIADFVLNTPSPTIEAVRAITYKAFQCGVSLAELAMDIIEACTRRGDSDEALFRITKELAHYEHMATQSKGMRTLLYMEYMVHYATVISPNKKKR